MDENENSSNRKRRYLIACVTIESYEKTKSVLSQYSGTTIEMNNYDGTYDFIIECFGHDADLLKTQGLSLISDAPLLLDLRCHF